MQLHTKKQLHTRFSDFASYIHASEITFLVNMEARSLILLNANCLHRRTSLPEQHRMFPQEVIDVAAETCDALPM